MTSADTPADNAGEAVAPEESLLRFASPKQWDSDGRPVPAALSKRSDEDGVSVYVRGLLASRALEPDSIITGRPGYGVFSIGVATAIREGCVVEHDPVEDAEPPEIGFAHALIKPPDKPAWLDARSALLASAEVLVAPEAN
ncbi:MAG: hypothetical protein ACR2LF_06555 [Jatrophihabitantaceae bacterium]